MRSIPTQRFPCASLAPPAAVPGDSLQKSDSSLGQHQSASLRLKSVWEQVQGLFVSLSREFSTDVDLAHNFPRDTKLSADRLDRLAVSKISATDLRNRIHHQNPNLGFHDPMEATVDPRTGGPIGWRSPRIRGPYSTPKHSASNAEISHRMPQRCWKSAPRKPASAHLRSAARDLSQSHRDP